MPTSRPHGFVPGDIVVVPFPYSDRLAEKRRPAVVVSNQQLAAEGFLWVVMVTAAVNQGKTHDVPIVDRKLSGLVAASIVRPTKIANIVPSRVLRRAGRLSVTETASVMSVVQAFVR